MCPIVLVTNIIITLTSLTILPKLLLQITDKIVSLSLNLKKRKTLLLNFRGLSTSQYRCFSLTFWVFWAFWNNKRKIEKQRKKEIYICNADLPC